MDAVLNALSYLLWVGIALGILVFIHELGHFLAAKLFRMRVDQFSIGFPPRIQSTRVGETEYRIGAVPLGGYVKIAGMIDESMDTDFVEEEPQPWEFRAKPVWQRIVVICAGVIFNLILAVIIFIGLKAVYGETVIPSVSTEPVTVEAGSVAADIGFRSGDVLKAVNGEPVESVTDVTDFRALTSSHLVFTVERGGRQVDLEAPEDIATRLSRAGDFGLRFTLPPLASAVIPGSAAAEAGLAPGDRIVALNGQPIGSWFELTDAVRASEGRALKLAVEREGRTRALAVTPRPQEDYWIIGIAGPVEKRAYDLGGAVVAGTEAAWDNTVGTIASLRKIVTGREDVRESVGGPILIARATKEAAEQGMEQFWYIVAMLSIALAIFNILPIPVLDGGHLVFLLYEGVTRREPSVKVRMWVQQAGFVLILAFFAFVIFNDISRW